MIYKRKHKRKDGKTSILYYGVVSTTALGSNRRSKDWGRGYRTRREAIASLNDRLPKPNIALTTNSRGLLLESYLVEQWLPSMVDRVEPTTFAGYETAVARVLSRLGGIKLQELTTRHMHDLYQELRERGGRYQDPARAGETRPLSTSTVRGAHAVMAKALSDAVDLGMLADNPAKRAKPPRVRKNLGTSWTAAELVTFLRAVEDDALYPIWRLAACTGMRRGELMGLRWCDVDLEARTLAVRRARMLARRTIVTSTPKSGHPRVVDLDDETAAALAKLRDPAADAFDLVVRAPDGQPMHPDRLSQLFRKIVRHCDVRQIRLHDLRHTHASLMLAAGVPIKVVSERLGHSDPAFTVRVYQHVLPGMQGEAAAAFAAVVRPAPAATGPPVPQPRGRGHPPGNAAEVGDYPYGHSLP